MQVLMQGLQSKVIDFEGQHYRFKNVPVELECVQKPTPPIWYGLSAAAAVPWTAENGINIVCNTAAKNVRPVTDRYREIWAGDAARCARAASVDGDRPPHRGRARRARRRSPAASAASIAGMRACSISGACTAIR